MKILNDGEVDKIVKKIKVSSTSGLRKRSKPKRKAKIPNLASSMSLGFVPFTSEKDRNLRKETNAISRAQLNYSMSKLTPNQIAEMWRKKKT